MAGEVLRQLLRKKAHTPKVPRGLAPPKPIGRDALIERRDRCMTELARLRQRESASGALADKAHHLLTAHWSASSWRARSDILRTAEWLLGVSRKTADAAPPARRAEPEPNSAPEPNHTQQPLDAVGS